MTDQREPSSTFKQIKGVFVGGEQLPTHYVNMVNARAGLEEFFLTFGTVIPLDLAENQNLEDLDSLNAQPLFRCAMPRSVMKQIIDLMTTLYENQTKQIEQLRTSQRGEKDYGNSNSKS
jgi:hypothetical protein